MIMKPQILQKHPSHWSRSQQESSREEREWIERNQQQQPLTETIFWLNFNSTNIRRQSSHDVNSQN